MSGFHLVVLAIATHQAVNVWRFSSLFAGWRNWFDMGCPAGWLPDRARWYLRGLFGCPWCLSIHVFFWLMLLWRCGQPADLVVYTLAGSQLANLIHHLFRHDGPKLEAK